ncbi:hypothetical protein HD553DRAFT_302590 [Filobasidium floriforme]|uniref:uncharacterized protein n=1 Tax=Filobasidium floriforme TaxID=5210 RepID=UPI001E8CCFA5|nr:uncharacterized protein HD553DRAFT_302590 [Filobasidium floriforme]KAH8090506.1 hypothetical protein HD553DRAFT_302590 [Filobasidium floriforme]
MGMEACQTSTTMGTTRTGRTGSSRRIDSTTRTKMSIRTISTSTSVVKTCRISSTHSNTHTRTSARLALENPPSEAAETYPTLSSNSVIDSAPSLSRKRCSTPSNVNGVRCPTSTPCTCNNSNNNNCSSNELRGTHQETPRASVHPVIIRRVTTCLYTTPPSTHLPPLPLVGVPGTLRLPRMTMAPTRQTVAPSLVRTRRPPHLPHCPRNLA